jgi:cell division protein FtsZ
MAINFKTPEPAELRPRIAVLGVGGAGGNAVNNMIASKLEGVEFIVANTDAQALAQSRAEQRIQLGVHVTEGLGAGAQPDVGRAGAEESLDEILEHLSGSHMVFITAGMGGGTGTGAAPVIARAVREQGILTVGVVTKPFAFEGDRRMRIAEKGISELQQFVHTLIVIPNQNLFRVANDRTTFAQAFAMADDVLHAGVRGVTDLIVCPGLINLDFADIKSVISEMGKAMMGTGEAEGEDRAQKAADMAISNPLLDDVSMKGARGVLINITGGPDLMLFEVEQAANRVRAEVDPDANIIFGNTILDNMEGRVRVSVVATGIDAAEMRMPKNVEPLRPTLVRPIPRMPEPVKQEARTAVAAPSNPVHRQVEALADELNAAPVRSQAEAIILGDEDTIREPLEEQIPAAAQRQIARESVRAAEPERRGWFLGRRKPRDEMRTEPVAAPRPAPRPAQPAAAAARLPVEPLRQTAQAPKPDDLFPDHKRDEQFEIPAFLRRQTN